MMEFEVAKAHPKYSPPTFAPPPAAGYLHVAATVAPQRAPFRRRDAGREALLGDLGQIAAEIAEVPEVAQVSVYRAILIPPARTGHQARYDVAVLIETRSVEDLEGVRGSSLVERMLRTIDASASAMHVMAARCVRFLGPVDRTRQGLFLFNHFVGPDTESAIGPWEHLAGWYAAETGLTNSMLLAPTGASSRYVLVNHARWEISPLRLAIAQLTTPTFRTYVQANLRAHHLTAMPVLYRLAWPIR
jgi:hypothetical protein